MRPADHVSRRNFLQAGALGVAGLAAVRPRVAWGQNNGEAKRGGTLVVRSGPLRGIDPHLETWAAALQVIHQTYNALLKFNPRAGSRRTTSRTPSACGRASSSTT